MLGFAYWFEENYFYSILTIAIGTIWGWPFSIVVSFFMALDILYKSGVLKTISYGLLSLLLVVTPLVVVDYFYYHKFLFAPLNIVLYNIFSELGPNLYGTAPWHYYVFNLFLNFNFAFLLTALLPFFILFQFCFHILIKRHVPDFFHQIKAVAGLFLWLLFMFRMEHKEERFLFVVYPLICFAAGLTVVHIQAYFSRVFKLKKVTFISL
jgi:alpha-1,2-mannosyltransferase